MREKSYVSSNWGYVLGALIINYLEVVNRCYGLIRLFYIKQAA
jgi:hypothetical protein